MRAVTTHLTEGGEGACVLEYDNGAIGTLQLANGAGMALPCERYTVTGRNCAVVIDNGGEVTFRRSIPFDYAHTDLYLPEGIDSGMSVWRPQNAFATLENKALFTQGFYEEMRYFCDSALSGKATELGSLEFARHLMQVYEAAMISEGSRIPL